jgi:hypothetical protein
MKAFLLAIRPAYILAVAEGQPLHHFCERTSFHGSLEQVQIIGHVTVGKNQRIRLLRVCFKKGGIDVSVFRFEETLMVLQDNPRHYDIL